MSVYGVKNDPQFRWGIDYLDVWYMNDTSPSGQSTPRRIATFDQAVGSDVVSHTSTGGMTETQNNYSYFDCALTVKNLDENATHYLYSFLAWANAGNPFRFAFDWQFDGAIGNITSDLDTNSTYILTDHDFPAGDFEVIIYNHLGQYDKLWVVKVSSTRLNLISGAPAHSNIRYNYTANAAIVKYAYYYHNAIAVSPEGAFPLRPGKPYYNWAFKFRETMNVAVLQ